MKHETFIFIGRSGCGKGTQAKLLEKYITNKDSSITFFHLESGQRFRDFIREKGYTNDLAQEINKEGRRQPDFLAVWMWSHLFIENLKGNEHVLIDGTPRSLPEAQVLHTAFQFYKREKPFVINLEVSREWSERHLLARGRTDDVKDDIKNRLDWFEKDVVPAVHYYEANPDYRFVKIDGEQPIEKVHEDLVAAIARLGV